MDLRSANDELFERHIIEKLDRSKISQVADFRKILKNLKTQNHKLVADLQNLKAKVALLREKEKRQEEKPKREKNELSKIREKLSHRYEKLRKLQKQSNSSVTSYFSVGCSDYLNRLMDLEKQIKTNFDLLNDERVVNRRISTQIRKCLKSEQKSARHPEQIELLNKELKNKITLMGHIVNSQQHSEIGIHSYQIQMREKSRKVEELIEHQSNLIRQSRATYLSQKDILSNRPSQRQSHPSREMRERSNRSKRSLRKFRSKTEAEQYQEEEPLLNYLTKPIEEKEVRKQLLTSQQQLESSKQPILDPSQIKWNLQKQRSELKEIEKDFKETLKSFQLQHRNSHLNYRRQGAKLLISKEKQLLETKVRIMIHNLKQIQAETDQKIREYRIIHQYYAPVLNKKVQIEEVMADQSNEKERQNKDSSSLNEAQVLNREKQRREASKNQEESFSFHLKIQDNQKQIQTEVTLHQGNKKSKEDSIGEFELENYDFDDSLYIHPSYIQELTVSFTQKGVSLLQATYKKAETALSASQEEKMNTLIGPKFPKSQLSHLKTAKTDLSVNDYVKTVKVLYNSREGFVAKLQVISKFNVKYEFGDPNLSFHTVLKTLYNEKSYLKFYCFNIGKHEFPGFMYGNYKELFGHQLLCGLGFKIYKE